MRRAVFYLLVSVIVLVIVLSGTTASALWWYFHPSHVRTHGIVYGQRHGEPLMIDVARPARPNGLGVALMVSGGWKSGTNAFRPFMAAPLLRRGYTVFAVTHLSQPDATVMDIFDDVSRAVRFIRHHAGEYGIDPDRIELPAAARGAI